MYRYMMIAAVCGLFCMGMAAPGAAEDGGKLYARCVKCHGQTGNKPPKLLKGQQADVLFDKLTGYAAGTYGGPKKAIMTNMVKDLSTEELRILSTYISTF